MRDGFCTGSPDAGGASYRSYCGIFHASSSLSDIITQSGVTGGAAAFLDPLTNGDRPYTFVEIFSQLAWGLGLRNAHILTRFMAVRDEKELRKSKGIAIIWIVLSLTAACFIGVIGHAYCSPPFLVRMAHRRRMCLLRRSASCSM